MATVGTTTYAAGTAVQPLQPMYSGAAATYAGSISAPMGGIQTIAAPAVTTMAAPVMASAPQTARMAGSASVPMLATQTMAAPMPQTPSYVAPIAAPQVVQAPVLQQPSYANMTYASAPQQLLQKPEILTTGIPTPAQVKVQADAYAAALDKQLADGIATIQKETEIEKQMVDFNFRKQKAIMELQIEEQRNEQLALLDEQATFRQCELKKAYVERKLQLDNQSNGLLLDYNMKAVQTELAVKQYEFQQNYIKTEGDLERQYAAAEARAHTGTTYADPAMAVKK